MKHNPSLSLYHNHLKEVILSSGRERKKILIIGDELDLRIFLCNFLGNCGYEPIDAGDKSEGLKKAKAEKPALIILDVMMPKEGGIQLYRNLKLDQDLKNVPVVMLSTIDKKTFSFYNRFQGAAYVKGVPEPGAYLEKPLETAELIRVVRKLTRADECTFGGDDGENI